MNETLQQLSPRADATTSDDRFLKSGAVMLAQSQTAQFFDRDNNPAHAQPALALLVEFMLDTDAQEEIQEELEELREEVFGAL